MCSNTPSVIPGSQGGLRRDPMRARVLCIAAHPDDEVLGVGGTLARHAAAGSEIVVLVMSEGEAAKRAGTPTSGDRRGCAAAAAARMGVQQVVYADLEDQRFDAHPFIELIHPIEALLRSFGPHVVYTHHRGDANTDHQVVFKATYAACRPLNPDARTVERLLCYEVPSSTEQAPAFPEYAFVPNIYIDIQSTWQHKVDALRCYAAEMPGWPHPRSVEYIHALSVKRGVEAGFRQAEAFALVREAIAHRP